MNRHLRRATLFLTAVFAAAAWCFVKMRNDPSDAAVGPYLITAAIFIVAMTVTLGWATHVDVRTQGASPNGVMGCDDRGRSCVLQSKKVAHRFRAINVDAAGLDAWIMRQPVWILQVLPHTAVVGILIGARAGARAWLPLHLQFWPYVVTTFLCMLAIMLLLRHCMILREQFECRRAAAFGVCGSCACSLIGQRPQDDGCTECPECGAAWRIELPAPPTTTG